MAYGIVVEGDLYCRAQPNTSATSYGKFPNGARLSVTDASGAPDWWQTTWTSGSTGYVMKRYVVGVGDTIQIKGTNVNVRPTASTSQLELYRLSNPATAPVVEVTTGTDGGWIKIQPIGKDAGWVRYDLVTKYANGSGSGSGSGTGWDAVKNGSMTLKQGSSSNDKNAVIKLQQLLAAIGYGASNVGDLTADGVFGSITDAATKKFQYECGLTQDGVVGQNTANKLEAVQNEPWFTKPEYYPLKASLMTYANYPNMGTTEKTERSIVVRAISAEHGYPGSTSDGHKDARIGVAKVLKNRTNPTVNVNRGKVGDYSFKSVYLSADYTSKDNTGACYLPRGYSEAMQHMHDAATTVVAGNWPSGASKVGTTHIYQKGSAMNTQGQYNNRPGFCRYPETGSSYTFFHIS